MSPQRARSFFLRALRGLLWSEFVLVEADANYTATAMYGYHPHYVDAVAVRFTADDMHVYLHDANFNVTAIADDAGAIVERYSYSPYGEVSVLDANFQQDSNNKSDIGNEYLYTGRRLDPITGLQLNRNRFYDALLVETGNGTGLILTIWSEKRGQNY